MGGKTNSTGVYRAVTGFTYLLFGRELYRALATLGAKEFRLALWSCLCWGLKCLGVIPAVSDARDEASSGTAGDTPNAPAQSPEDGTDAFKPVPHIANVPANGRKVKQSTRILLWRYEEPESITP